MERLLQYYWWPKCYEQVREKVENWNVCAASCHTYKFNETLLVPISVPETPWSLIAMDLYRPFNDVNFRYLLVIVNRRPRYPEISKLQNIDSKTVVNALTRLFDKNGLPECLISDNNTT